MEQENKIVKINDTARAIHLGNGQVYTVAVNPSNDNWQDVASSTIKYNWERQGINVQGRKVVAYGDNNDLPVIIRSLMDNNHLAPGILERKIGLLYGEGPQLYKLIFENGIIRREYTYDEAIWNWLNGFDYLKAIQMAMTEYNYLRAFFVRRYRNRGARIGKPAIINKIEVVPAVDARLEWPEGKELKLENVSQIITGDFENNCFNNGVTAHPVYNPNKPFEFGVSMSYHDTYSFGRKFYPVPSYYGTIKWIGRSSDIPDILKYLTDNGIVTAYHVHTPAGYWEQKLEKIKEMFPDEDAPKWDKRLQDLEDATFLSMTNVLTGKKNTGKFITSVDFYDDNSNLCSWKIEPIDQEIKDFTDSQLKISEMANSATTSGMGLHPSLSNIVVNGQLSSGSQVLYALKNYFASETAIPEEVIFEPFNQAIKANFPDSKLKLGFYRTVIQKEEDTAPADRMAQKV